MNILKSIDKFMLSGFAFSVILSFGLYIVGVDTISSVIIGLLGTILTVQLDQVARMENAILKDKLSVQTYKKIENATLFTNALFRIIDKSNIISESITNSTFQARALLEIEKLRDFLDALSKGQLLTGFRENEIILSLMEGSENEFIVTSPSLVDDNWWDTPMGEKFWQANVAAIKRRVKITRIFLFETETLNDDQKKRMKQHQLAGVNVLWITIEQIPVDFRISAGVFDNNVGYQLNQAADGSVSDYVFTIDQSSVRKLTNKLERLAFMSNQYNPEDTI